MKAIGWQPLELSRELGPWDMIWTQKTGRVEIEILEYGPDPYTHGGTDVKDSKGEYTSKKRFPGDSFFILRPSAFLKAKANKIVGDVFVATNRDKVKEFFEKYRSEHHRTKWGKGTVEELDEFLSERKELE